ncbi:hypothetical protein D3C75_1098630 [compost metagenome]
MTREEYNDCVSKLEIGTLYERLQATVLLSILPTYESKTSINDGILKVEEAVRKFQDEQQLQ